MHRPGWRANWARQAAAGRAWAGEGLRGQQGQRKQREPLAEPLGRASLGAQLAAQAATAQLQEEQEQREQTAPTAQLPAGQAQLVH